MSDLRETSTTSDRRAYGRLRSGLLYHRFKKKLFVTLTFPHCVDNWDHARRVYDWWLRELRLTYKLEYFRTATREGNGAVFHQALVGPEVPTIREIRDSWQHYSGATQLDVQWIRQTQAFYLEMTRQQKMARYSSSRGWLFPNAREIWKKICREQIHYYKQDGQVKMSWNAKTAIRRWQEAIQIARDTEIYLSSSEKTTMED